MTAAELIEALGGTQQLATAIGVTPAAVRNWRKFGRLPPRTYLRVQALATQREIVAPTELFYERPAND